MLSRYLVLLILIDSRLNLPPGKIADSEHIVATVSIKRIPDPEIVKEIYRQSHKTISRITVFNIRKRIKQDSYR